MYSRSIITKELLNRKFFSEIIIQHETALNRGEFAGIRTTYKLKAL